jgi:hypothetical protein
LAYEPEISRCVLDSGFRNGWIQEHMIPFFLSLTFSLPFSLS